MKILFLVLLLAINCVPQNLMGEEQINEVVSQQPQQQQLDMQQRRDEYLKLAKELKEREAREKDLASKEQQEQQKKQQFHSDEAMKKNIKDEYKFQQDTYKSEQCAQKRQNAVKNCERNCGLTSRRNEKNQECISSCYKYLSNDCGTFR